MFKNAKRHLVFGLLLGGLGMATVQVLKAQAVSNANVTGRVVDEQEAVVSGAQIRMTAVNTGAVVNAVANGEGIYTIPNLPIGEYTLQATSAGFQTYVQTGILLRVGDNVAINIPMKVGRLSESVEVHANASLVQTQQNTISQVIDQQRIVDLPLNGRDPTQLITISGLPSITAMEPTPAVRASSAPNPSPSPAAPGTPRTICWTAATTTTASRT